MDIKNYPIKGHSELRQQNIVNMSAYSIHPFNFIILTLNFHSGIVMRESIVKWFPCEKPL